MTSGFKIGDRVWQKFASPDHVGAVDAIDPDRGNPYTVRFDNGVTGDSRAHHLRRAEGEQEAQRLPEVGQRIRLVRMGPDPCPIEAGATGTVRSVSMFKYGPPGHVQIGVDWDNGRTLMLALPEDRYEILD
ncbi:DUF4314 domain-containing protein [Azospirillum sp. sgz302134]